MSDYVFDTHVHTAEVSSCGKVPAREMVQLYKNSGYTGIIITDHYYRAYFQTLPAGSWETQIEHYLTGYNLAVAEGRKLGMDVLLGLELRFNDQPEDYLVYGVDRDFLISYPHLYDYTIESFAEFKKMHNLLVVQAHPFRPGLRRADAELLDGVEVFNGNPRHNSHNELARKYAKDHELLMLSGSDAHEEMDVGTGGIYLPERISTSKAFAQYLWGNHQVAIRQS